MFDLVVVLNAGLKVWYLDAVDDGGEAFRLHNGRVVWQTCDYGRLHEVTFTFNYLQVKGSLLIGGLVLFSLFGNNIIM